MNEETPMLVTTMNDLPGYEIEEVLGSVFGLTVRSRHIGSTLGAAMKSVVGGELKERRSAPTARPCACDRLPEPE
jgi:uncharacterized protein YbjQ (UPF0145 family)